MDDFRSFKRKDLVGALSYQYQNASAGPSFAAAPMAAAPAESDATQTDAISFIPQYSQHDPASVTESGAQRGPRNRSGLIQTESAHVWSANNLIQGSYVAPPVQLPGSPWMAMPNADVGNFAWPQAHNFPYLHGKYLMFSCYPSRSCFAFCNNAFSPGFPVWLSPITFWFSC